jgi:dihydrofolate reductase
MPVIMGRKTFESMGKPLKGRTNIVITSKPESLTSADLVTVPSVEAALDAAADTDAKECYVIGGGQIFRATLPVAHKIYMTRVHTNIDGDTYFPPIDKNKWTLVTTNSFSPDAKHAYSYSFEIWQRNKAV